MWWIDFILIGINKYKIPVALDYLYPETPKKKNLKNKINNDNIITEKSEIQNKIEENNVINIQNIKNGDKKQ